MSEQIRPTEINISLASQLIPEPRLPFHSASFYVDHALEAGYQGHEWYPLNNSTLVGIQTNHGKLPTHVQDSIKSAHQSWRSETNLVQSWNHPNKILAIGSYVLFPQTDESLNNITDLQRRIGKTLQTTVYPETQAGKRKWPFPKLYQPTKGVKDEFGATDISGMIQKGYELGYDGLTLDIHHMLTLGPWQEVLPQLLPHTREIHVALGRIEDKTDPKTEQKLEDLYFGIKGTEIFQILEIIKNSKWTGMVVTEIPYQALRNLRLKHRDSITTSDFMEDHRRIVDQLKETLL